MPVDFPACLGYFKLDPSSVEHTDEGSLAYYHFLGQATLEVQANEGGAVIWDYGSMHTVCAETRGANLTDATLRFYDLLIKAGKPESLSGVLQKGLSDIEGVFADFPLMPMIRWSFYPDLIMFVVRFPSKMVFGDGESIASNYVGWHIRHLQSYRTHYFQYDRTLFPTFSNLVWMTEFLVPAAFLIDFCKAMAGRQTFPIVPELKMLVHGWLTTTFDHEFIVQEVNRPHPWRHQIDIRGCAFGDVPVLVN